jgi:hypothetical protein
MMSQPRLKLGRLSRFARRKTQSSEDFPLSAGATESFLTTVTKPQRSLVTNPTSLHAFENREKTWLGVPFNSPFREFDATYIPLHRLTRASWPR